MHVKSPLTRMNSACDAIMTPMNSTARLASILKSDEKMSIRTGASFVFRLALPAILAQVAEIVMQYIDSAMVGQMGAGASASIGLVASSTWLFGGLISACGYGFSVQAAQRIGAQNYKGARDVCRQSFLSALIWSGGLMCIGIFLSSRLPVWLGGAPEIIHDAHMYFLIYALFIPVRQLYFLNECMLQSTGDMRTPSILSVVLCASDVFYNALLIFPSGTFGPLPGANMGVAGAALGTALSYVTAAIPMIIQTAVRSPVLALKDKGRWMPEKEVIQNAFHIGIPLGLEHAALSVAQILAIRIVAPLGTISLAANSFAVTAESFCYMPGYGIAGAATTLVGQAYGAKRKDLCRMFSWLSVFLGMALMTLAGIAMYWLCPYVFEFLTPVQEVQILGEQVLRIELHAEPLFAASIVAAGALRGAGDTFVPFLLNLVSMWGIRLTLAYTLSRTMGLPGVWYAMATELSARGILFLIRLKREKWLEGIDEPKEVKA